MDPFHESNRIAIDNLKVQDELVVVADNCNDATSEIAYSVGARVLERKDSLDRGKGYALDFGIQHLKSTPPDVVICIDADCQVESDAIENLAEVAAITQRPVQSLYLFKMSDESVVKQQIVAFAIKIRNYVRPLGLSRLGMPSLLFGSGMAFPWQILESTNIATANIVEDIKLGFDLTILGYPPIFCPQSKVTSYLPTQSQASTSQKTRWEQGHLQMIRSYFPRLIKEAFIQKRIDLAIMAWDLAIPPTTMLALIWLFATVLSIGVLFTVNWNFPFFSSLVSGFLILASIVGAWIKLGKNDLPLVSLAG